MQNTDSRILFRLKTAVELDSEIEIATLACSTLTFGAVHGHNVAESPSWIASRTVNDIWYPIFLLVFFSGDAIY